jgi:hypothetical protein
MSPQQKEEDISNLISTISDDMVDPSKYLAKQILYLTLKHAELMKHIWFDTKGTPPYGLFAEVTELLYVIYCYTSSHFRRTRKFKLAPEEHAEIKEVINAIEYYFKVIPALNSKEFATWNEFRNRTNDLDTLVRSYLNILNLINLHMIGSINLYTDPRHSYAGSGAI